MKVDVQEVAGPLQTTTGLQGGDETATHAMKNIFEDNQTEAVLLVDASNSFNSLNCMIALYNMQVLSPKFSPILINTYREPSRIIVIGNGEIMSREGTTQSDNFAMSFYAIGIAPLLRSLKI